MNCAGVDLNSEMMASCPVSSAADRGKVVCMSKLTLVAATLSSVQKIVNWTMVSIRVGMFKGSSIGYVLIVQLVINASR